MKYSTQVKAIRAEIRQLSDLRAQNEIQANFATVRYITDRIQVLRLRIATLRTAHKMKPKNTVNDRLD